METPVTITIQDLHTIVNGIKLANRRGAFELNDSIHLGLACNRIEAFIKSKQLAFADPESPKTELKESLPTDGDGIQ